MSYDTTEPSLLLRLRDPSDAAAWRQFEAKYQDLVTAYCRRRGIQPADCDDIRQRVWMLLASGLSRFEYDPKVGRFRNYLRRVVQCAIARHFARPDRSDVALDTTVLAVTEGRDTDLDKEWDEEWVSHHYRLAMQTVRRTFEARSVAIFEQLLAGSSVAAVAALFQTTEQAVHKVKQRIRDRMAELIDLQVRAEDESDVSSA
jgi:RNA polymerase sigma-70 factor (ECF subfamily)